MHHDVPAQRGRALRCTEMRVLFDITCLMPQSSQGRGEKKKRSCFVLVCRFFFFFRGGIETGSPLERKAEGTVPSYETLDVTRKRQKVATRNMQFLTGFLRDRGTKTI